MAVVTIAVIAVAAIVILPSGGGSAVDVVAQARAAVTPREEILHVRSRLTLGRHASFAGIVEQTNGPTIGTLTGETERWTADNPFRQRTITFYAPPGGGPALTEEGAYVDGVERVRQSWHPGRIQVQITSLQVLPARPNDDEPAARHERRLTERLTFTTFERIPLNDKTEALLRLSPPPHR